MGLRDWIQSNYATIEKGKAQGRLEAQAEMIQAGAPQAQQLMGYNTYQTGQDGLTTGMASGLMAGDMNDPRTFMELGTGLMSIPGYQQVGQQVLGQAVANQLGRPYQQAQLQQQALYQQQQLQMQKIQMERSQKNQRFQRAQALVGRADKVLAPIRDALGMFNTAQNMIIDAGGFANMSGADDEALIKSYAKMVLPKEAVMTDDAGRIVMSDNFDSFIRGLKEKFNVKGQLSWEERKSIYESMMRQAQGKMAEYNAGRQDFERFSHQAMVNPDDVLREAIRVDFGIDMPVGDGAKPSIPNDMTEADAQAIRDKVRKENPGVMDSIMNKFGYVPE